MNSERQFIKSLLKLITPPIFQKLYLKFCGLFRSGTDIQTRLTTNVNVRLSQRKLNELFPGIEKNKIDIPVSQLDMEAGTLPLPELLTLIAICEYIKPQKVFEIGTFKGRTTLMVATHVPIETEVFTLDLPPEKRVAKYPIEIGDITGKPFAIGELYRGTEFETKIHQLYGDSVFFDFNPFYGKINLVFIDGNHNYENVRIDSENAFRILYPGGVIIWDDYDPVFGLGVMRALHEITGKILYQIAGTRFAIYIDRT